MKIRRRFITIRTPSISQAISLTILVCLISAFTQAANAGTKTWSGGDRNDANWTSNGNWAGIGGGGPNDDLIFPSGAARATNNNDFPTNTSFKSLTFKGGGYVISGNQIFLENGMTINRTDLKGPTDFNPNIILGSSQVWLSTQGFINQNGVLNLNGQNLTVDGPSSLVMKGLITGSGTIIKAGFGELVINGNAAGFGTTILNQGTVQVGGTLGHVGMNDGVLSGTGTVASLFASPGVAGGKIAPGNGSGVVGTLSFTGLVSLNSTKSVSIDLKDFGNDLVKVTGSNLDLNSSNLELVLGFTPAVGRQFTIISHAGAGSITGQFSQGSAIVVNSQLFTITYGSNSVVLIAQGPVVP